MTVASLMRYGQDQLGDLPNARLDTLVLLEHVTGLDKARLLAHLDTKIGPVQVRQFKRLLARRAADEPVAYLIGHKEFFGLKLKVTPAVLIPRPESETLVELATLLTPKHGRLIDVGTGSGALAVAIATQRPDLEVHATDISATALKVARQNSRLHRTNIQFYQADLWPKDIQRFDTVVANLPYVAETAAISPAARYEPAIALFSGADGLALYQRLLRTVTAILKPGGHLIIEVEPKQHGTVKYLASSGHLKLEVRRNFTLVFAGK